MIEEQRFFYKPKQIRTTLILALLWLALVISAYLFLEWSWVTSFHFIMFASWLILYFYRKHYGYLLVKPDSELRLMWPFSKPIYLNAASNVKVLFGDLIIKAKNREITIASHYLSPDDFEKLCRVIANWVEVEDVKTRC